MLKFFILSFFFLGSSDAIDKTGFFLCSNNLKRPWKFTLVPGEMPYIYNGFRSSINNSQLLRECFGCSKSKDVFSVFMKDIRHKAWPCGLPRDYSVLGSPSVFRGKRILKSCLLLRSSSGMTHSHSEENGIYILLPRLHMNNPSVMFLLTPSDTLLECERIINHGIFKRNNIGLFLPSDFNLSNEVMLNNRLAHRYLLNAEPGVGIYVPPGYLVFYLCMENADLSLKRDKIDAPPHALVDLFTSTRIDSKLFSKSEHSTNIIQFVVRDNDITS